MVAVVIDDHARETVARAPDQAAESRVQAAPRPILDRLRDPALEKNRDPVSAAKNGVPRFAISNYRSRSR